MMQTLIPMVSKRIAANLHAEIKAHRISAVGIDAIRAACAGYLSIYPNVDRQRAEELVDATLRRFVEACP